MEKRELDTPIYIFCPVANLDSNNKIFHDIVTENKFKTFSPGSQRLVAKELLDVDYENEERSEEGKREAEWI